MWRDYFETEYCFFNQALIFKVKYIDGLTAFTLPLGEDRIGCLMEIDKYCKTVGIPTAFCTATEEDIEVYKQAFASIQLSLDEDWNDYLYRAEDLITLSGRKYNGQRNHINFFKREYANYRFEEIDDRALPELRAFHQRISFAVDKHTNAFYEERNKTIELLDNYEKYGLMGGLIRVEGIVVAFAIGEIIKDTLFVHVEKADNNYRGAYQMIVNLFPQNYASEGVMYINREEDLGDEGLRIAKKAYHPIEVIKKYSVIATVV